MTVRTTITLPDALKARMDAVEEDMNWSAEAAKCFEQVLGRLAARKRDKDLDAVVARLRADKIDFEDADYAAGYSAGNRWARDEASYPALEAAANYRVEAAMETEWDAPWRGSDWIAFAIHGVVSGEEDEEIPDAFWGDPSPSTEYMTGFVDAARAVWAAVVDKI